MKPKYLIAPENYVRRPLPTKTKWVTALRSGDYSQCDEKLTDGESYCCLGLLSKIQGRLKNGRDGFPGHKFELSCDNPLREFLGTVGEFPITYINRELSYIYCKGRKFGGRWYTLAAMNDNGYSFSEIADVIDFLWYDPETETP